LPLFAMPSRSRPRIQTADEATVVTLLGFLAFLHLKLWLKNPNLAKMKKLHKSMICLTRTN